VKVVISCEKESEDAQKKRKGNLQCSNVEGVSILPNSISYMFCSACKHSLHPTYLSLGRGFPLEDS
jgi:hypothetical protein